MAALCSYGLVCLTGTYAGMTERLDYLTTLGINAIELQPIHEFNELEYYQVNVPSFLLVPHMVAGTQGFFLKQSVPSTVTSHICTPCVRD